LRLLIAQPLRHKQFIGFDRLQKASQFPRGYLDAL